MTRIGTSGLPIVLVFWWFRGIATRIAGSVYFFIFWHSVASVFLQRGWLQIWLTKPRWTYSNHPHSLLLVISNTPISGLFRLFSFSWPWLHNSFIVTTVFDRKLRYLTKIYVNANITFNVLIWSPLVRKYFIGVSWTGRPSQIWLAVCLYNWWKQTISHCC